MISRRVEAVRTIVVRAPAEVTVAVVNDIASIHLTERKADTCELLPESETTGTYRIAGHVARIVPWRGNVPLPTLAARFPQREHGARRPRVGDLGRLRGRGTRRARQPHRALRALRVAVRDAMDQARAVPLHARVDASRAPRPRAPGRARRRGIPLREHGSSSRANRRSGRRPRGLKPFPRRVFWMRRGLRRRGSVPTQPRAA